MKYQVFELNEIDDKVFFEDLGRSYDSAFIEKKRYLFSGNPKQEGAIAHGEKDLFYYEFISDQYQFSKKIKESLSGKASGGFGKVKASASRDRFFSSNSYSCYIFGYMRLVEPKYILDLRDSILDEDIKTFIEKNQDNIDFIEKEIGDEIITGITLTSEIIVKMEIRTSSEREKEEIMASAGASNSFASGSVKFRSIMNKYKKSKRISIDVYGNIPDNFISNVTAEEVDKMLIDFPNRSKNNFSILEFSTTPINQINQFLKYKRIVNNKELDERKVFLNKLELLYQDHLDWKNDINYVISENNKLEFTLETIEIALTDLNDCERNIIRLGQLYKNSYNYWDENGINGDAFNLGLFLEFPENFPIYERVEVKKPLAIPPPKKPKPKPSRNRREPHGGDQSRF